jgi:hypothetical protein
VKFREKSELNFEKSLYKTKRPFYQKSIPIFFFKQKNLNFSAHRTFFGPIFAKLFQIEWKSPIL